MPQSDISSKSIGRRSASPALHTLRLMALGAVGFWLPDTLWHIVAGSSFGDRGAVLVLALLMPLTLLGTYLIVLNRTLAGSEPDTLVGGPMMLGVWLFGGLFVNARGFSLPDNALGYVSLFVSSFYPPHVFENLVYNGGLPALIVASVSAPIVWAIAKWIRSHDSF